MTSAEQGVRAAVDAWFIALNAMIAGDPEPFAAIVSHADDVLYMSGEGTYRVGFAATFADWKLQAAKSLGGHAVAEDVHIVVSGDMAAATLVSLATVKVADGTSKDLRVRQSQAFRNEGGSWKLVMHHADNLPVWQGVVGEGAGSKSP